MTGEFHHTKNRTIHMKHIIISIILLLNIVMFSASAQTISTYIANKEDCETGNNVSIPVFVRLDKTIDIGSISLKILYDPAVLSFQRAEPNALFQNMLIFNSAQGAGKPSSIAVSWYNVSPVTLSDSMILLTLHYTYKGGNTFLQFNNQVPGNCEYGDANALPVPTDGFLNKGKVSPRKEK